MVEDAVVTNHCYCRRKSHDHAQHDVVVPLGMQPIPDASQVLSVESERTSARVELCRDLHAGRYQIIFTSFIWQRKSLSNTCDLDFIDNTPIKFVLLLYFDNTWVFSNTVQKIFTVSIFMSHWEHQDGWVWSQSALVAPSLSTTVIMFQKQKLSSNNGMLTYWHTALMFETEPRDWGTNSLRWDIVSAHSICWKEHPFQGRNAKYSIVLQCYWNDT